MIPDSADLLAAADDYFRRRPHSSAWHDADGEAARLGALEIAAADIAAALHTATPPFEHPFVRRAVFEQALHLLAAPPDPAGRQIVAESIDGVGSRSYRIDPADGGRHEIAPRARLLLDALPPSAARFTRG